MPIPLRKEISDSPPSTDDELLVNGMTVVLFDAIVLKERITAEQLSKLTEKNDDFSEVTCESDYISKIFSLNDKQKQEHKIYLSNHTIDIGPFELSQSGFEFGELNIYFTLYKQQFLLVQIVGVLDINDITDCKNKLKVTKPLNTNDILKLLDTLRTKEKSYYKIVKDSKKREVSRFLNKAGFPDNNIEDLSERVRQPIGIQIWDIASLQFDPNKKIKGSDLQLHYAWELSALLSFYTEHFRKPGRWRDRSKEQVERECKKTTDVVADHRVIHNERICLEISQVNHPTFDPVSKQRFYAYGYDRTSLFLWGYFNLQDAACEYYKKQAKLAIEQIEVELNDLPENSPPDNRPKEEGYSNIKKTKFLREFVTNRLKIIDSVEQHLSLRMLCLEGRHRKFFEENASLREFEKKALAIQQILNNATMAMDLTKIILAIHSENANVETNKLLQEVKNLNENQSETTVRLGFISLLIGTMGIAPMADFIINFDTKFNIWYWKGSIVLMLLSLLILVIGFIYKFRK